MTGCHPSCRLCTRPLHPRRALWWGFVSFLAIGWLAACTPGARNDTLSLRDPTVSIGAISRFEQDRFAGRWQVEAAAGDWALRTFVAAGSGWSENGGAQTGQVSLLGRGIFRIAYDDASTRDVWVVWIDPDHNTAALGDPDGQFGVVATRVGARRSDQIRAAEQVLDFNGYRTGTWARAQ
ncbi:MAG: hypothetical protein AAGK77_04975 [Pseudomonadota bacterium]